MKDPIFEELGQLHTPEEAARYLDTTERAMEYWRANGRGPKYVKIGGAVRYPYKYLREWLLAQTVCPECKDGEDQQ